jgi:hypothetical protein
MQRFMAQGHLPTFQRFFTESLVYTTEARERAPYLDPWIQWLTVHTGVNFAEHRVEKLNEGHTYTGKRLWDLVSEQGGTAWVCGSMSTRYEPGLRGALVPDPWTTETRPTPEALEPYFSFVRRAVQDSTVDAARFSARDSLRFLRFMAGHGLRIGTLVAAAKQLLEERAGGGRWKRPVILDRIQLDLFRHIWKAEQPDFATFFLNSTAHFQHLHWREMEPEVFTVKPSEAELAQYRSAILFGYQNMDRILADLLTIVDDRTTVVLATAISQQPFLTYEDQGGKHFYRPRNFQGFLQQAGVTGFTAVAPVMAHQFQVEFPSEEAARRGEAQLSALRLAGQPMMSAERIGAKLFTGCRITSHVPQGAAFEAPGNGVLDFYELLYRVDGLKSGMHHPDGIFWMRRPERQHQLIEGKLPLDMVAPLLLDEMGMETAPWMRQDVPQVRRAS